MRGSRDDPYSGSSAPPGLLIEGLAGRPERALWREDPAGRARTARESQTARAPLDETVRDPAGERRMPANRRRVAALRIAMVEPVGGHCGMDYYDFGLVRALAQAGVDVVLHTCDETAVPPDAAFQVRHSFRGVYGAGPRWLRGLRYVRGSFSSLFSAVREGRRIVHFHLFHVGALELANVALAKALGRKIVVTSHDVEAFMEDRESRWMRWLVYRFSERVIAHNAISKTELMEHVGVDERRIRIIRHGNFLGLVPGLPDRASARDRFALPPAARVILYFGQIKDVKGVDVLLRALPKVTTRFPDAVLILAGNPRKSDFSRYQALIDQLDIAAFCRTHIRYIPTEELPYFFAAADVVALPYRRIYQSGVVLLAMSYAKAVVASDLPGFTDIIEADVSGYIFERDNPDSLGDTLCRALASRDTREAVAGNGLARVRDHYDWDHSGRDTARLYEELA